MPEFWSEDPTFALNVTYNRIDRTVMRDAPGRNPALHVEAVGFHQSVAQDCWLGALITPWALHLICLPARHPATAGWPTAGTVNRAFASGPLKFTAEHAEELGHFQQCLLFSPPSNFASQATAKAAAEQVLRKLAEPLPVAAPPAQETAASASPPVTAGRRRLFGFGS